MSVYNFHTSKYEMKGDMLIVLHCPEGEGPIIV